MNPEAVKRKKGKEDNGLRICAKRHNVCEHRELGPISKKRERD
jgi:hypothetical protein